MNKETKWKKQKCNKGVSTIAPNTLAHKNIRNLLDNGDYLERMEMRVAENPDTGLVEIVESENHPFFIGQSIMAFKSHPLFVNFVAAMVKQKL